MDFTRGAPSGPPVTIAWACIKRSICKRAASHPAGTRGARAPTGQTRKKGAVETLFWSSSPDEGAPAPDRPGAHPGTGPWWLSPWAIRSSPLRGGGSHGDARREAASPGLHPGEEFNKPERRKPIKARMQADTGPVPQTESEDRSCRSRAVTSGNPGSPAKRAPGPSLRSIFSEIARKPGRRTNFIPDPKRIFSVIQEVLALGGILGLPVPGGRGADPVEYVLLQVYELLTVRCESERTRSIVGAAQPADPAHI